MSDDGELDLNSLSDEDLVFQVHDDLQTVLHPGNPSSTQPL